MKTAQDLSMGVVELVVRNLDSMVAFYHQGVGLDVPATVGHVHLQVGDIPIAELFYSTVLGFDVMTRYKDHALFVAAGGYHHHNGLNFLELTRGRATGGFPWPGPIKH